MPFSNDRTFDANPELDYHLPSEEDIAIDRDEAAGYSPDEIVQRELQRLLDSHQPQPKPAQRRANMKRDMAAGFSRDEIVQRQLAREFNRKLPKGKTKPG